MKCISCNQDKLKLDFPTKGNKCILCNREYFKKWRDKNKNNINFIEYNQNRQKEWWSKNRERGNERQRIYRKGNSRHRLSANLRQRVKYALLGCVRQDKTFDLLGCSPIQWKEHLESLFKEGMSWDNYGDGWEVDHITPVSHFNLNNIEEQKKAFNYLNTQPMWKLDNRKKGNRWIG